MLGAFSFIWPLLSTTMPPLSLPALYRNLFSGITLQIFTIFQNLKSLHFFLLQDPKQSPKSSVHYGDIGLAKAVHASILKLEEDTFISNALIVAYLKLGRIEFARRVFKAMSSPDVVSCTALISGFAKSNRENEAIELFLEMRYSGIEPNEYSFVALLPACIRLLDLELGLQVHAFVLKLGFLDCIYVVNALMGLYSKCSCLDFVIELFNDMPIRDIASWNTVISSLVKECMYDEAFEFFRDMLTMDGFRVDYFTLSSLLASAAGCSGLREGWEVHAYAIKPSRLGLRAI